MCNEDDGAGRSPCQTVFHSEVPEKPSTSELTLLCFSYFSPLISSILLVLLWQILIINSNKKFVFLHYHYFHSINFKIFSFQSNLVLYC